MGLTIHYTLHGPVRCDSEKALSLVRKFRRRALAFKAEGRVEEVSEIGHDPEFLVWCSDYIPFPCEGEDDGTNYVMLDPEEGHLLRIVLGEGSESLKIGLCRYGSRVTHPKTGAEIILRKPAWRLSAFCKTQYASVKGMDNFLRCHTAAADLLREWKALGGRARVSDEGGYWPHGDEESLRGHLERMNRIVAGFAGYLKDRSPADGSGTIQSPIFEHPQFEHLEAEGREMLGDSFLPPEV